MDEFSGMQSQRTLQQRLHGSVLTVCQVLSCQSVFLYLICLTHACEDIPLVPNLPNDMEIGVNGGPQTHGLIFTGTT